MSVTHDQRWINNQESTNILLNVFATDIGEIAEGTKSEKNKLVVKGIEFTKRRSVEESPKQSKPMLKGTGTGDEFANQMGKAR